jgi:hypothetical protein
MIVDAESLLVPIQRTQFSQERQIFLWILLPSENRKGIANSVWRTFCEYCAIIRTSWKLYIPSATSYSRSTSERKMMNLIASSTMSGCSAGSISTKTHGVSDGWRPTLEMQKDAEARFVVCWTLAHMCGEHRLDIPDQVLLLQEVPEGVADRVDLLSVARTAESASVVGNGTEGADSRRTLHATKILVQCSSRIMSHASLDPHSPERGHEEVEVVHFGDLLDEVRETGHEPGRLQIV